jgi:hypothetical protein
MSYAVIADITESASLRRRVTACAAQEARSDPDSWAYVHRWDLASQPGWADAWASAVAASVEDPGADEGVITDPMILSAVQAIGA